MNDVHAILPAGAVVLDRFITNSWDIARVGLGNNRWGVFMTAREYPCQQTFQYTGSPTQSHEVYDRWVNRVVIGRTQGDLQHFWDGFNPKQAH